MNYDPNNHLLEGEYVDIFRDLDTDLMEIFHRGHFSEMFRNLPAEEHDRRIEALNRFLRRRYERDPKYVKLIWLFRFFPLPVVKYRTIWNDIRPNLGLIVMRALTAVVLMIVKVFRLTMFIIGSSYYLKRIFRTLLIFGNELTFSTNFFRDVYTYILRDHEYLFYRLSNLETYGWWYTIGNTNNIDSLSNYQYFRGVFLNFLVSPLMANCNKVNDRYICFPNTSSLIYKFEDVFKNNLPETSQSSILVVLVYLLYALVGNFICMNIFYLYSLNFFNLTLKYHGYLSNLFNTMWEGLSHNLI